MQNKATLFLICLCLVSASIVTAVPPANRAEGKGDTPVQNTREVVGILGIGQETVKD
jgi:hypothetical protein